MVEQNEQKKTAVRTIKNTEHRNSKFKIGMGILDMNMNMNMNMKKGIKKALPRI